MPTLALQLTSRWRGRRNRQTKRLKVLAVIKEAEMITRLKREIRAVRLAASHPRTPKAAKWLAGGLIAYAVSPIDLIPDFIPVLGHLDDAVILPLGVWLLWKMVPADVKAECRQEQQPDKIS